MRIIQEYLKECDRKSVFDSFWYKYQNCFLRLADPNKTLKEIRGRYEQKVNELINKLILLAPVFDEERMIFLAIHCVPETDGEDIRYILIRESDIGKEWAMPYGYSFTPFEEAISYYVADTYLTQLELTNLLAEFLFEVSFTGFDQEHLQETLNSIDESAREADEHRDDPDYFITHEEFIARLEDEFDIEFEKKDPQQEEAWKEWMHQAADYNQKCQQIEIAKLADLLKNGKRERDMHKIV